MRSYRTGPQLAVLLGGRSGFILLFLVVVVFFLLSSMDSARESLFSRVQDS